MTPQPNIIWDQGSAYDLFTSLLILHQPDKFGLRPSWAAGVRSRLPNAQRDTLEQSQNFIRVPLAWIHALPAPRDAATAIAALEALSPEKRIAALMFANKQDQKTRNYHQFLLTLQGKKRLTARIESRIKEQYATSNKPIKLVIRATFETWSDPKTFGEKLLDSLKAYINNFFEEEEARIQPAQESALMEVQQLLKEKDLLSLLEELSVGVRMDWVSDVSNLVLAPSFWGAPFMFFDTLDEDTGIVLFGARPKGIALVPGELIPEDLINGLKALADPTRLRILHYLQEGPCTPSELAKILRLRPPTVIHHLQNLRLAGLVRVTVTPEAERRYAVRMDGVDTTVNNLKSFLSKE